MKKLLRRSGSIAICALLPLALGAWAGFRLYSRPQAAPPVTDVPVTRVKRGKVVVTVTAKGELQGASSEMMIAPMTGGREMAITFLRGPGEVVGPGAIVVKFDTTEQEFVLREAEADLDEAEQQVLKATAESKAREEEMNYQLLQAKAEVRLAELETRRNPLLAAIVARQNNLALEAANDRLRQIQNDIKNRKANTEAGVAIQEAARSKAKVKAETAKRNIDAMTLKSKSGGYVAVQQNSSSGFFVWGMQLPIFQVGDTARPGMAVAQIPDLQSWEVSARIGELDRGHLKEGQAAGIQVVALPGKTFAGKVRNIGGTTGPPWDRHFVCKIALDDPSAELRPGMTAKLVITTDVLDNALWVPSQALFESDGRTFVYLNTGSGFTPRDVAMVRRSESQVVLKGLSEGHVVALANPDQTGRKKGPAGGAIQALGKKG
jgi:multidrug efflux pump subunit AcrA (membrane-fusion protein)